MDSTAGPLAGRTVVVTADRRAAELVEAFRRRGARVQHAPMMSTIAHADDPLLIERTRDLISDPPDVVVVTTGVGFRGWLEAAAVAGLAADLVAVLHRARLVVRGPKALGVVRAHGLTASWVAPNETSAEMRDLLVAEGVAGLRIAVQHHGAGADGVDEALHEAGADVCSLVVYRWAPPQDEAAAHAGIGIVADGRADAVVFTSAPAADAFVRRASATGRLPDLRAASRAGLVVAAVGPVTAAPLQAVDLRPVFPDRWRMGALIRLVVRELSMPRASGGG